MRTLYIVDRSRDLFTGFEPVDVLTGVGEQLHVMFVVPDADLTAAKVAYADHVWGALEQPIDNRCVPAGVSPSVRRQGLR